jgi:hypothetical protein
MLPAAKFRASVVDATFDYSPNKGTPFVRLTFAVVDEGEHFDQRCDWYGYLPQPADSSDEAVAKSTKAAERVAKALATVGYQGDDPEEFRHGDVTLLCPNVVAITVEHEEFNGRTKAKVAWINPVGSELPTEKKSAFKDSMKAAFAAARADMGAPAKPVQRPAPKPAAAAQDEIPF